MRYLVLLAVVAVVRGAPVEEQVSVDAALAELQVDVVEPAVNNPDVELELPIEYQPELPIEQKPELPIEQNSELPIEQNPELPIEQNPELPIEQNPELPIEPPKDSDSDEILVDTELFLIMSLFADMVEPGDAPAPPAALASYVLPNSIISQNIKPIVHQEGSAVFIQNGD